MITETSKAGMGASGRAGAGAGVSFGSKMRTRYHFEHYKPTEEYRRLCREMNLPDLNSLKRFYSNAELIEMGLLQKVDEWTMENIVVNTGLDDLLDKRFKASTYTSADYVGLTDGTPTVAAGDTMSSHAGWSEVTAYSEGTREALTLGSISSASVDNSASKASFSISSDSTTIGGAFITTDNTKGGTSGILYGAGAFTAGDKGLDNGDTLNVTVTLTTAAS